MGRDRSPTQKPYPFFQHKQKYPLVLPAFPHLHFLPKITTQIELCKQIKIFKQRDREDRERKIQSTDGSIEPEKTGESWEMEKRDEKFGKDEGEELKRTYMQS